MDSFAQKTPYAGLNRTGMSELLRENFDALDRVQARRADYVLTDADIGNGYAVVPVVWAVPFPSTNYTVDYCLAFSNMMQAQSYSRDFVQNKTAAGLEIVVAFVANDVCAGDSFGVEAVGILDSGGQDVQL